MGHMSSSDELPDIFLWKEDVYHLLVGRRCCLNCLIQYTGFSIQCTLYSIDYTGHPIYTGITGTSYTSHICLVSHSVF